MTFLPMVERELRAAVRRPLARWSRLGFALTAAVVVGFALLFTGVASARAGPGGGVFRFLVAILFVYTSLAGVWLTADCLSRERREGTLGLLFLTDLRGYDVVLGKLTGRATTAFYGWLAVLPILAISMLIGGVTAGEFWRIALTLASILFLSLTLGLLVSSVVEQEQRAMGITFLILVLLNAGVAVARQGSTVLGWPVWVPAEICPALVCLAGFDGPYRVNPSFFWRGTVTLQALAWGSLLAACLILPRSWQSQETGAARQDGWRPWTALARRRRGWSGGAGRIEGNPFAWLVDRTVLLPASTIWLLLACVLVGSWVVSLVLNQASPGDQLTFLGGGLALALRILLAFQATRFFTGARESGALELLLTVPAASQSVIDGQLQALKRRFQGPVLLAIGILLLPALAEALWFGESVTDQLFRLGLGIYAAAVLVADLYAMAWLGMLLALGSRRPRWVPLLAMIYLIVLPLVAFCVPRILIDLPVIFTAQDRLRREFQLLLRRSYEGTAPHRRFVPPPLPPGPVQPVRSP